MEGCLASHDLGRGELTPSVVPLSSNSMVYLKRLRPVKYDCSAYFVTFWKSSLKVKEFPE